MAIATVLVVDDESLQRRFVAAVLAGIAKVIQAASAEEALQRFDDPAERIDILVTDVSMPGMDGIDLARAARARVPTLPIVIVSGSYVLPEKPVDIPGSLFLPKPVDPVRLREVVALLAPPR